MLCMSCRRLTVDPQRINHSNGNFVQIVGALCLIQRGSKLDAVIVADPGGLRRLAYARWSRPAASAATSAPTAAEGPAICGPRRTDWPDLATRRPVPSPRVRPAVASGRAPGSGGQSRRRRREQRRASPRPPGPETPSRSGGRRTRRARPAYRGRRSRTAGWRRGRPRARATSSPAWSGLTCRCSAAQPHRRPGTRLEAAAAAAAQIVLRA
jgi:hypothetical protein